MAKFGVPNELSSVYQVTCDGAWGPRGKGAKLTVQLTCSEYCRCGEELHQTLCRNTPQDGESRLFRGSAWAGALYRDFVTGGKSGAKQRLVLTNDMNMHPMRRHLTYQQLFAKYSEERRLDGPTLGEVLQTRAQRRVVVMDDFDSMGCEVAPGTWCEPLKPGDVDAAFDYHQTTTSVGTEAGSMKNAAEMDAYIQLFQLCDASAHPLEASMRCRKTGVDVEWVEKALLVAFADPANTLRRGFIWHPIKSSPRSPSNPVKILAEMDPEARRRTVYVAPLDLIHRVTTAGYPESYAPGYKGEGGGRRDIPFLFSYPVGADEVRLVEGKAAVVGTLSLDMVSGASAGATNNIVLVHEAFRSLGSFDGEGAVKKAAAAAGAPHEAILNELWMPNPHVRNTTHQFS
ncbi:unnamed protein product [Ostreobium quekettii]|uniref:Uncharacterized protein n=1 Tax=Ostreobium quekettii TaxID=121088 RepID=A0A8S1IMV9_9CHLO|nr:unnamed protein product [Ostreobium quekettii]|eukprot:evm.model.scf_797.1 EVM.evm.TU.scf_797.1   scf_797:49989-51191(-)